MYDKLFIALLNTNAAHWEQIRKCFEKLGLTEGQPKVLYTLRAYEGCVQKELAAACRVRESTLTVLLRKLEDKGCIRKEKIVVSVSKHANAIFLTDHGRELSDKIDEKVEELERKCFEGFSEEEKQQLFSLLYRVENNLKS
ncbi:MAG: MarR family transcriptional regulator [Oscillospiraceae bacterium]|nr:MarR family transcriptional regulator [Oscillospiraceae bacterium]